MIIVYYSNAPYGIETSPHTPHTEAHVRLTFVGALHSDSDNNVFALLRSAHPHSTVYSAIVYSLVVGFPHTLYAKVFHSLWSTASRLSVYVCTLCAYTLSHHLVQEQMVHLLIKKTLKLPHIHSPNHNTQKEPCKTLAESEPERARGTYAKTCAHA